MKHLALLTLVVAVPAANAVTPEYISDTANFQLKNGVNTAEIDQLSGDGGGHPLLPAQYSSILTAPTWGLVDMLTDVPTAFAEGLGGAFDFSTGVLSDNPYIHPVEGEPIPAIFSSRTGDLVPYAGTLVAGNISIERGANFHVEGGSSAGYRGEENFGFDGTGPSPATNGQIETGLERSFFQLTSSERIGGTTSWDLSFDAADNIIKFGLVHNSYNNFQSFQRFGETNPFPNIHARATFSDGSQQMSVAISEQNSDHNTYFGFTAPDGEYLTRIEYYQIGNNSRSWVGIREIAYVQAVPEPSTIAMIGLGIFGLGFIAWRRRR